MESAYKTEPFSQDFKFKLGLMRGNETFLFHWHDLVEIMHSVEGSFNLGVENETYCVNEGESIIIASGASHCIFPSSPDARRIAILFSPELTFTNVTYKKYENHLSKIERHSSSWHGTAAPSVGDSLRTMQREYTQKNPGWREMIHAEILKIAAISLRDMPLVESRNGVQKQGVILQRVLEYLGSNYSKNITLESCSAELGYNKSYLSTMFTKKTGLSFHKYLTSIRLNAAEWMLKNDELSIAETAERAGFSSTKTFHRVFQSRYGTSPGSYRKNEISI